MYKLTFIKGGKIRQVTSPSYWTLFWMRHSVPGSRLWNRDGSLAF